MGKRKKKKNKIGRNDKCPCGSNIKFKKCCMKKYRDTRLEKITRESAKPFEGQQFRPLTPIDFRNLDNASKIIEQQQKDNIDY